MFLLFVLPARGCHPPPCPEIADFWPVEKSASKAARATGAGTPNSEEEKMEFGYCLAQRVPPWGRGPFFRKRGVLAVGWSGKKRKLLMDYGRSRPRGWEPDLHGSAAVPIADCCL